MGKIISNFQEVPMKHFLTILNTVLASGLVIASFVFGMPNVNAHATQTSLQTVQAAQEVCDSSRSVQVSGTAVVNVVPDRALVQLGVQSNGSTPGAVESANTNAIQKVIKAVQALGVPPKDIATDWYIIEPIYESYDSLYIKGYRINNLIAVTLRDVSQTSRVIAVALEAGANQVVNVEFYTSELRQYRDQARELAMKAASEKAQALAGTAAAELGCVMNINENTWSYYNGGWYGRDRNLWTQNTVQNVAPSNSAPTSGDMEPVSLGQISVRAEVGVTFGLK
jgi:uncharacterized protein YggE